MNEGHITSQTCREQGRKLRELSFWYREGRLFLVWVHLHVRYKSGGLEEACLDPTLENHGALLCMEHLPAKELV